MKIPVAIHMIDGGDGSQIVRIYNTVEELVDTSWRSRYSWDQDAPSKAEYRDRLLNDRNPFHDTYEMGHVVVSYLEVEDGKLAAPFSCSAG